MRFCAGPSRGGTGDEGISELTKALDHLLDPLDGLSAASRAGPRAATGDDEKRGSERAWQGRHDLVRVFLELASL
jgi:hypothetical protein